MGPLFQAVHRIYTSAPLPPPFCGIVRLPRTAPVTAGLLLSSPPPHLWSEGTGPPMSRPRFDLFCKALYFSEPTRLLDTTMCVWLCRCVPPPRFF